AGAAVAGERPRCSFAQERFWFIDEATGGSAALNVPWAVRLHGPVDVTLLERALAEVVRRHETLRTHFVVEDGQPVQIIEPSASQRIRVDDVSAEPDPERAAEQLVADEAHLGFDLGRTPLL